MQRTTELEKNGIVSRKQNGMATKLQTYYVADETLALFV